jgi:hypothetical protein
MFINAFVETLPERRSDCLVYAGMTSDGCVFQQKAFLWHDPESILQNLMVEFTAELEGVGFRNVLTHTHRPP